MGIDDNSHLIKPFSGSYFFSPNFKNHNCTLAQAKGKTMIGARHLIWHILAAVILMAPYSVLEAQTSLPPSVQADVLKTKIVDAFQAKRPADALAALDQYHQLEAKCITMPPVPTYSATR